MQQPLISVIVPIYKVEEYIDKCVESILAQTYKNIEVWLIDDGSPDRCGEICDKWAKFDNRVNVVHKPNGGVSDARNTALDLLSGEYITCVDGDDSVAPDYIEIMYKLVQKYDCELAMCNYELSYDGNASKYSNISYKEKVFSAVEATKELFYQKEFDNYPWCKLYHKSLFDQIRYPKGVIFEDLCVSYKLFLKCKKIAYCNKKALKYLIRRNSYEGASFSTFKMDSAINALKVFEQDEGMLLKRVGNAYCCRLFCFACHLILKAPKGYLNINILWNIIKKYRKDVLKDRNARVKARFAAILSYFGLDILKFLFRITDKRRD